MSINARNTSGADTDINVHARFSGRADVYQKFRPRYPEALLDMLTKRCGLTPQSVLADIGAGTGVLSEMFLRHGHRVLAVEPNADMRAQCCQLQAEYPKLECIAATAEATGLLEHSVDMVTVGQALHWFDRSRARQEFSRILRAGGWIVLVWNDRCLDSNPFHVAYEAILQKYGVDYAKEKSRNLTRRELEEFFAPSTMELVESANSQELDRVGLEGRIVSSSYMPHPGHARYEEMRSAIHDLFAQHQQHGIVRLEYICRAYIGYLE